MNISAINKQPQKTQRYFSIDMLKLLFCIFIIMYHSKGAFSHLLTNNKHLFALFFKNQTLLVDCFFIFSGVFLYQYCQKQTSVLNFIKKRIFYLYPSTLLAFSGLYLFHLYGKVNFLAQENLSHILIYGILKPTIKFNNFDYSWYVFVLLFCSVCLIILKRILPLKLFNIFVFFLFIFSIYFYDKFYILSKEFIKVSIFNVTNLGVIRGFFGILLGYLTGIFIQKYIMPLPQKYFICTTLLEIIAFCCFFSLIFSPPIQALKWIVPFLCCFLLCLCFYSNGFLTQKLNQIQFSKLGHISFSIYIFQGIAFLIFNHFFFNELKNFPSLVIFILYILFPLIFGTVIFYLIDTICFILKRMTLKINKTKP